MYMIIVFLTLALPLDFETLSKLVDLQLDVLIQVEYGIAMVFAY